MVCNGEEDGDMEGKRKELRGEREREREWRGVEGFNLTWLQALS